MSLKKIPIILDSLNTPGNGIDAVDAAAAAVATPGTAGAGRLDPHANHPGIPLDAITPKVTRGRSISIKNRFKNNRNGKTEGT